MDNEIRPDWYGIVYPKGKGFNSYVITDSRKCHGRKNRYAIRQIAGAQWHGDREISGNVDGIASDELYAVICELNRNSFARVRSEYDCCGRKLSR